VDVNDLMAKRTRRQRYHFEGFAGQILRAMHCGGHAEDVAGFDPD
jgi:hypothetical protein